MREQISSCTVSVDTRSFRSSRIAIYPDLRSPAGIFKAASICLAFPPCAPEKIFRSKLLHSANPASAVGKQAATTASEKTTSSRRHAQGKHAEYSDAAIPRHHWTISGTWLGRPVREIRPWAGNRSACCRLSASHLLPVGESLSGPVYPQIKLRGHPDTDCSTSPLRWEKLPVRTASDTALPISPAACPASLISSSKFMVFSPVRR